MLMKYNINLFVGKYKQYNLRKVNLLQKYKMKYK